MKPEFRKARDRRGDYLIDWTRFEDGNTIDLGIQFVPFCAGDARVMSVPADETMFTATGRRQLEYGLIAMRIGDSAVHLAMSPAGLRQYAGALIKVAELIEAVE